MCHFAKKKKKNPWKTARRSIGKIHTINCNIFAVIFIWEERKRWTETMYECFSLTREHTGQSTFFSRKIFARLLCPTRRGVPMGLHWNSRRDWRILDRRKRNLDMQTETSNAPSSPVGLVTRGLKNYREIMWPRLFALTAFCSLLSLPTLFVATLALK